MAQNVNAEIISIGTEILLGEITDTNSVYIARSLRDIGVNVFYMTSVGDNENRITDAIQSALRRAQIVITTGGLGPTVDDMTRQGVANATNRELVFHQDLLDKIAERFSGFRSAMTENNRRQAYLPDQAILIENPVGTAPSFVVEHEDSIVISLPGVPREMKYLMVERIIPFLQSRYQLGIIKALNLRAAGIGESALDDVIGAELLENNNPTVGLAAHSGVIDIRVTAKADTEALADEMIAEVATLLRERVGSYIFGTDLDTIEAALVERLRQHDASLAICEAGIGDPVSSRFKAVPESDGLLVRLDQYQSPQDIEASTDLRDLAQRVAERISLEAGATVGIAVLSNPEQNRDQADSDVGTAVAVYLDGQTSSRVYGFGAQAAESRLWTSTWALSRAWRMLEE
ncbi:MAG: competence/damage-inducible protein A [Anaerolineaceae bacterium]|nr:competence/damage-inducible protein A [Anaerolineaceae bacterium]